MDMEKRPVSTNEKPSQRESSQRSTFPLIEESMTLSPEEVSKIDEHKKNLNRRTMLGVLAGGAVASTIPAGELLSYAPSAREKARIHEQMENVSLLETVNARYKIVYANHSVPNNPDTVNGSDALVLEIKLVTPEYERGVQNLSRTTIDGEIPQYKEIVARAIERNIPIYMPDEIAVDSSSDAMKKSLEKTEREELAAHRIRQGEVLLGAGLVGWGVSDVSSRPTTKERIVSGLTKLFGSSWFLSQVPDVATYRDGKYETYESSENDLGRKLQKVTTQLNVSLHPETLTRSMEGRSALIAEKSEMIAGLLMPQLHRKPVITIVIGAGHSDIETHLRESQEERLSFLRSIYGEDLVNQASVREISKEEGTFYVTDHTHHALGE